MKKSSEENRSASRASAHADVTQNRSISQMVVDEEQAQAKFKTAQLQGEDEEVQAKFKTAQLQGDDEDVQAKFKTAQLKGDDEEVQAKFKTAQLQGDDEEVQAKFKTAQLQGDDEEVQAKFKTAQLQGDTEELQAKQLKADTNKTGMPDNLKSGIESLSGVDVSDVRVHYNSSKPAQMNAHAYAQGTNIHIAPSQEQHLPHEAWHTVQQKQGRVQPTTAVNGTPVNDNTSLENEADVMGAKALQMKTADSRVRPVQMKLNAIAVQLSALSEAKSEFKRHEKEFGWAKGWMGKEVSDLSGTPDSDSAKGLKHWAKETKEGAVRHYNELHFLRNNKGSIPNLRLGKSNSSEPDLKGTRSNDGKPRHIEVKTTHSTDNSAINKLVVKALTQLQNRKPGGGWSADVVLYLENAACLWPNSPSTSTKNFTNALKDQASIKINKPTKYKNVKIVKFQIWRASTSKMTSHTVDIDTL